MAREVLKPIGDTPPDERHLALLGGNYGAALTKYIYLGAALVTLILLVLAPPSVLVMWWVKHGLRRRQWSGLFKVLLLAVTVGVAMLGLPAWMAAWRDMGEAFLTVLDAPGAMPATYLAAMLSGPVGIIVASIVLGVPCGFIWAWWEWQKTPARKAPKKHKTLAQSAVEAWHRRRIADGRDLGGDDEVVYGTEIGKYDSGDLVVQRIGDMLHTILFGTTGSGKTQTMFRILLGYIANGHPAFLVDMKGSTKTRDTLRAYAEKYDRPFYEFSLNGPMHYDMLNCDDTDPTRQKDMLIAAENWSEEYYKGLAEDYLLTLFKIIQVTGPMQGHSVLATVAGLLDPIQLRRFVDRRLTDPSHDGLRNQAMELANKIEDDPRSVAGLASKVNRVVNSVVGGWLTPDEPHFTLRQAYDENAVVLVSLNHQNYPQLSATVGSFVLQDLKSLSGALQARPTDQLSPWLMAVDEFTHIEGTAMASAVQQVRESGARVLMVTQAKGDMAKERDPAFESVVWGQADTVIAHACDDETAEAVALRAGDKWGYRQSQDTNERNAIVDIDRGATANRGRVDFVPVPRLMLDVVKHQEPGQCIIIGKFEAGADEDDGFWARARRKITPKKVLIRNVGVVMDRIAQEHASGREQVTVAEGEIAAGRQEAPQIVPEDEAGAAKGPERAEVGSASREPSESPTPREERPAAEPTSRPVRVAPGWSGPTKAVKAAQGDEDTQEAQAGPQGRKEPAQASQSALKPSPSSPASAAGQQARPTKHEAPDQTHFDGWFD